MRPLITPINLQHRLWRRALLASLTGGLLLLLLLPTLLTLALQYQLPRMGLGRVEIGNIDINPFRGKLTLEEVSLYRAAAQRLHLKQLKVDLAMLSLMEQRLHIQSLSLDGLTLTVEQQDSQQPLTVAGIPLPLGQTEAAPAAPSPWGFGIDDLELRNSAVQLIHPQLTDTLRIEQLSVGPLAMWRPEYVTPLRLKLQLDTASLDIKAKSSPFAEAPHHRAELVLSSLQLANFAELAKPTLARLQGSLSSRMQLDVSQDHGRLALKQQGSLSLGELALQYGDNALSQQKLEWSGSIAVEDLNALETLAVKGDLKLSGTKSAALSLQGLSLNGITLQGRNSLKLTEVVVDGLSASAQRSSSGVALVGIPASRGETRNEKKGTTDKQEQSQPPFNFHIGRIRLQGNNRLAFSDSSVKPSFSQSLTVTEAELAPLDSSQPQQLSRLMLKAKDDKYTRLQVEGELKPLSSQPALNLKAKLSDYDMPPATPYLAQLLGYRITTGQLDSDVTLQIDNNQMKGEVVLQMNQLKLEAEDPQRIKESQEQLTLPLNTALTLLRDKDDNIKLKVPISGRLDDPQFDINDIINTALGKSIKLASVSYLKLLLQPYSTLITVAKMAGEAASSVQLDPVLFAPGSSELSGDAVAYVEKLSKLTEKKGINLRLCGFATQSDLEAINKEKKKKEEPQTIPPEGHPQLEALARERAETIKAELVEKYGASPKQLFICHPELDRNAEAGARVELGL